MNRELGMLGRQVRHELVALRRTPVVLVLGIGFPLGFFVLVAAVVGNETIDARAGVRVAQFVAPAFASFGLVLSCFSFLAVGLVEARVTGVLKRQNGTPAPRWVVLGGRMGAALVLGMTSVVLVLGVGVVGYDVQLLGRSLVGVLVTLVVAALTFAALGLAVAVLASTPQAAQAITSGVVFPLAFISDIFAFGGAIPGWLDTVGWVFPLRHLVNALGDAFNPFLTGNGFAADHLAVLAAWGIAGAVAATMLLRRAGERSTSPARAPTRRSGAGDAVPRRTGRVPVLALLVDQIAHANAVLWRDASAVFFAVAFPVIVVVIIPALNGGGEARLSDGRQLAAVIAAAMATYGAAVSCFVTMPEAVARARARKVLKREHGTPLPLPIMLLGRVVGAAWVALLTLLGSYLVAGVLYGVPVPSRWWAVLLTLLVAVACFAALGLVVVSLVAGAESVVGISLGILLPLAFVSDIFLIDAELPPVLDRVAWFFPLRHAVAAMTRAAAPPDVVGAGLQLGHLAVLLGWTAVGVAVVAWRFSWEGRRRDWGQDSEPQAGAAVTTTVHAGR